MRKILFSIFAVALPVYAMAQCPSTEAVTATVTLQYSAPYMLEGEFSVSQYTKVNFSQGNLQYKASAAGTQADPQWFFAEHQWDYIGNRVGNTTAVANRATQSDTIDLFGWGTSGNPACNCEGYEPYYTVTTNKNYGTGVTSGEWNQLNCDWGVANAVQLGLGWRVLTNAEWTYLLNTRTASTINGTANARYVHAFLFGTHHGMIIFPDVYVHPDGVALPTGINSYSSSYWNSNQYNAADWEKMENAGCVFLPAAGSRSNVTVSSANVTAYYWSSTVYTIDNSYSMLFQSGGMNVSSTTNRSTGCSVRLVKEHQ